ncbi:hypothetical protein HH310_16640 [Actinoplanes sp. TBRC 11911]|uniref:hypothetical protein n=1 Tax=Actinoplanes sp. TBRC 11911 TaxID=2729386 RepID=UPI00145DDB71|nr:hypothetical protein [Actinoplanes sp. TBRC 11911]NMO52813.1 hypothetical protein [Actinoplanes sp. TBRC 11911]
MTQPTLRGFFFTRPADAEAELAGAAESGAGSDGLGRPAIRGAVFAQIGEKAAGVLDRSYSEIFQEVWGRHDALRQSAANTRDRPGSEEIVEMTTYDVSYQDRPVIEVQIGELEPVPLEIEVVLRITVRGLIAVIRDARLVALRAGTADVSGTLSFAGTQVAAKQATLELPGTILLGRGVPLLGDKDPPTRTGTPGRHRDP